MAADTTALTPAETRAHATADAHASGGIGTPVLGMLLFITSEVMFFAGLFAAYFSIRANYTETINGQVVHQWPPAAFQDILNPFELFTQYGIQIKARSRALQTFIIQLTGPGTYLPTTAAVRGGGYSAIVASSVVGPEGGQVLVDRTVGLINSLWPEK